MTIAIDQAIAVLGMSSVVFGLGFILGLSMKPRD